MVILGTKLTLTLGELQFVFERLTCKRSYVEASQVKIEFTELGTPVLAGPAHGLRHRWRLQSLLTASEYLTLRALLWEHQRRLREPSASLLPFVFVSDEMLSVSEVGPTPTRLAGPITTYPDGGITYTGTFLAVAKLQQGWDTPAGLDRYRISMDLIEAAVPAVVDGLPTIYVPPYPTTPILPDEVTITPGTAAAYGLSYQEVGGVVSVGGFAPGTTYKFLQPQIEVLANPVSNLGAGTVPNLCPRYNPDDTPLEQSYGIYASPLVRVENAGTFTDAQNCLRPNPDRPVGVEYSIQELYVWIGGEVPTLRGLIWNGPRLVDLQ